MLAAASTTGRLLILKEGAVEVVKDGVEIAKVTEPGAVFGELSVLLDQPHTADVRALKASQFHVADAGSLLRVEPFARASRAARSGKPSRGWKDCWVRAGSTSSMPATRMTRSHRTASPSPATW